MKDNKIAMHTEAINLARRWSVQNENDLMQEEFNVDKHKTFSHDECQKLASHMIHPTGLPEQCRKYQDVVTFLKRHDTDTAHPTQWLG